MDDTADTPGATALVDGLEVPAQRGCTRCDGEQHLVASGNRMGKYRCGDCELVIGFDADADPAEFLISRGLPRRYTRDVFGDRLLPTEQRLEPVS